MRPGPAPCRISRESERQRGPPAGRRRAACSVLGQHDLALGDVAGQVGDRVGDVARGHGQHRDDGDRPGRTADPAAPFVERGEVAVEVARVRPPARDLAPGRRDLPQRLGVAGHVGQHHQDVPAGPKARCSATVRAMPRGQHPLHDRVVGGVQQQHQLAGRGALLEGVADRRGVGVGQAHPGEDHRRTARRRRSTGPRSGWPARGAGARRTEKIGSFWPRTRVVSASMAEMPVSTGSAGGSRCVGLSGNPATGAPRCAEHRRTAVDGVAAAVADPAQPAGADRDVQRLPGERDPGAVQPHPVGALQHLHHRQVAVHLEHQAVPRPPGRPGGSRELVPADARARRGPRAAARAARVQRGCARRRASGPVPVIAAPPARASIARRVPRDGVRVGRAGLLRRPQQRAVVDLLERRGGTPRLDQLLAPVDDGEHRLDQRRPWWRSSDASLRCSALCCSTPSRSSRPASITIRSCPGIAAAPTSSASVAEPVGLGEQRQHPARRCAQLRVAVARRTRRPSRRRRGRTSPTRPPRGSAARRPGRGPGVHSDRDEPLGVRGDRLGEVAAGRGDRADDRDRPAAAAEGA